MVDVDVVDVLDVVDAAVVDVGVVADEGLVVVVVDVGVSTVVVEFPGMVGSVGAVLELGNGAVVEVVDAEVVGVVEGLVVAVEVGVATVVVAVGFGAVLEVVVGFRVVVVGVATQRQRPATFLHEAPPTTRPARCFVQVGRFVAPVVGDATMGSNPTITATAIASFWDLLVILGPQYLGVCIRMPPDIRKDRVVRPVPFGIGEGMVHEFWHLPRASNPRLSAVVVTIRIVTTSWERNSPARH